MKLVNGKYGITVEFQENRAECLVVESPKALSEMIQSLCVQGQGGDGDFILQENAKELKLSKATEIVLDPFSLTINSKKYISKLYDDMKNVCLDIQYEELNQITRQVVALIDQVELSTMHDIEFDLDMTPDTLFKMMNVKFSENYGSLKEKLCQYLSALSLLQTSKLVIFVHLKGYLTEEELHDVYETAFLHKISLLLIESVEGRILNDEKCCILDRDLCIIKK